MSSSTLPPRFEDSNHPAREQLADPVRLAAKYRIPLLNQVAVLGNPAAVARQRTVRWATNYLVSARDRLTNVARLARLAGYQPALFGYTDQGVDPRLVSDPDDPRLSTYEGVLPGFDAVLDMSGWQLPWLQWLNHHGYDFPDPIAALRVEHELQTREHRLQRAFERAGLSFVRRDDDADDLSRSHVVVRVRGAGPDDHADHAESMQKPNQ